MSNFIDRFDKRVDDIVEADKQVKAGHINYIPFKQCFPRLSRYLRGIIRGTYYIITAQSGVGKSKLARYMFIKLPYDYYKSTGKKIKLKIIYFALEESADEIIDYLICQRLSEQFKIRMSPETLSLADNLPADIIDKIRETREYFADLDLDIVDNIANPFGMYKYCREVSNQLGTHHYKEEMIDGKPVKVYSHYKSNDPDQYVIALFDHYGLVTTENNDTLRDSIGKLSSEYMRKQMTKNWKWVCVGVQQQESAGENMEHIKGMKLEPTLAKLGDNKATQRDALVILGLFAPDRYSLEFHNGQNITRLKDSYRSLHLLKNRKGTANRVVSLAFDGATERFSELPSPKDINYAASIEPYYKRAEMLYNNPDSII